MLNIRQLGFIAMVIITFQFTGKFTLAKPPVIHNTRISMSYDGLQADGDSYTPTISNNGRFVVFASNATNLVPNDTNGKTDVFVFDLETEILERVSVASTGIEGNGNSGFDDLMGVSDDGRYVVFSSEATNLVVGDTNINCHRSYWDNNGEFVTINVNCPDIFVKDRLTNEIRLVSVSSDGVQGNGASNIPSISADGRYVAFMSFADNLVKNDTNKTFDTFVYDLQTRETKRVSIASDGAQANDQSVINRISANGGYVVFETFADNLSPEDIDAHQLDVYLHNMQTGETSHISVGFSGNLLERYSLLADISGSGRYVSFMSGLNGTLSKVSHIYRRDQQTKTTEIVSISAGGDEGNKNSAWSSISDNGRWVAFTSEADNFIDVGGRVCNNCENVYLKDMDTGEVKLLTKNIVGNYSGDFSNGEQFTTTFISGDGSRIVFDSLSDDLVLGDTNGYRDIFIYGWKSSAVYSVNLPLVFQ